MSVEDTIQDLIDDSEDIVQGIRNAYDEVQSKGGTIPQNKNTNNLAEAIGSIPTGSTPSGQIEITQNGTYDVTDKASASVAVPDYLAQCANKTMVNYSSDELLSVMQYMFQNCPNLDTVQLPKCTTIGQYAFDNAYSTRSLNNLVAPKVTTIGRNAISYCKITSLLFPLLESVADVAFYNNNALAIADVGHCNIASMMFRETPNLINLVLRKTSVATVASRGFENSGIASSSKASTVYVPSALVSAYQADSTWGSYPNNQFKGIENNLDELRALGVDVSAYEVEE